ncbi:MAG: ABC transporter permease [Pseudobdellovibrionaceae bacterium]
MLNLSIGLIGFLCLDAFKTSLDRVFQDNAKSLLTADVEVSVRRLLTEEETRKAHETVKTKYQDSRAWELFSMVAAGSSSRLVQVKAVDANYPLYGSVQIQTAGGKQTAKAETLNQDRRAWVYPELLEQLGITIGDSISIGGEKFQISGTVLEDSSQGLRFGALASRIYVGLEQMKKTQLVTAGSTLTDNYYLKVPENLNSLQVVEEIKKQIPDPSVRIKSYQSEAEDSGRALKYLSDYLGLVSLVALFLAALGSAYLFRSFIYSRYYQIAILNALGLNKKRAQKIYLAQLLLLGLGASMLSLLGATLLLPLLTALLKTLAPISISVILPTKTVLLSLVMGVGGSLIVGWPFLKPTERLQTALLLTEGGEVKIPPRWQDFLLFVPSLVLYWGLSLWQAKSIKVGSQFVGLFLGSLVALWVMGWILLRLMAWVRLSSPWPLRQALFSLSRRRLSSLAVVVSLGLGTLLMNLLPQLKVSLKQDLMAPENLKLPSLFLFDIQDEQVDPLKTYLTEKKLDLQQMSALVRARIVKVNGQDFERAEDQSSFQTREEENRSRFRNRSVNLTYRDRLTESESLEEGREFSGPYSADSGKPVELSVEKRFAERMEFQLNDKILFDIQGIPVEGQIVNLRSVKWNSFQPNFFIQMQPGVLEEAPKTFLASISALPADQIQKLQSELVKLFPNVSIVDVAGVIEKVLELSDQMSWSLELMAALSLFAGFVVLFSIANYEVRRRSWDLNLLKIFGASRKSLFQYLLFEFGLLSFLSCFFGVLISLVLNLVVAQIFFEGTYQFDLFWPLISLVFVTLCSMGILWFVSRQVVLEKPSELLQQK